MHRKRSLFLILLIIIIVPAAFPNVQFPNWNQEQSIVQRAKAGAPTSYWFSKDDSQQVLTDTSWTEQLTLDFTAPAQGDYLIIASTRGVIASSSNSIYMRVQLDDTTDILSGAMEGQGGGDFRPFNAFYVAEDLASGSHYVDLDAYVETGTGYFQYSKLFVIRLDDWLPTTGMYAYNSYEAQAALSTSYSAVVTLTFTPDQAGDYLVLFAADATSASTSKSVILYGEYDSESVLIPLKNTEETGGDTYLDAECKDGTDVMSFFWGGIVTIPASSKTITLQGGVSGGSATADRSRILAIRLAAMSSAIESTEDDTVTSTSSSYADKDTLSFTPSATGDYWILGGMVLKPDADGGAYSGHARLEQTAGTSTGTIGEIEVISKDASDEADAIPFMTVEMKELADTTQTFKTQYGYVAGGDHYGKASLIVAVPLEDAADADPPLFTYDYPATATENNSDVACFTAIVVNWSIDDVGDNPSYYHIYSNETGSNSSRASGVYTDGSYKSYQFNNANTTNVGSILFFQCWANDTGGNSNSSIVYFNITSIFSLDIEQTSANWSSSAGVVAGSGEWVYIDEPASQFLNISIQASGTWEIRGYINDTSSELHIKAYITNSTGDTQPETETWWDSDGTALTDSEQVLAGGDAQPAGDYSADSDNYCVWLVVQVDAPGNDPLYGVLLTLIIYQDA